jgi:hypothetical protein
MTARRATACQEVRKCWSDPRSKADGIHQRLLQERATLHVRGCLAPQSSATPAGDEARRPAVDACRTHAQSASTRLRSVQSPLRPLHPIPSRRARLPRPGTERRSSMTLNRTPRGSWVARQIAGGAGENLPNARCQGPAAQEHREAIHEPRLPATGCDLRRLLHVAEVRRPRQPIFALLRGRAILATDVQPRRRPTGVFVDEPVCASRPTTTRSTQGSPFTFSRGVPKRRLFSTA